MKHLWLGFLRCLNELLVLYIFLLMIILLYNSKLKGLFSFPYFPRGFYFTSFCFECFYFLISLNFFIIWTNPFILLLTLNQECKPVACKQLNEMQLSGFVSCIRSHRYNHNRIRNNMCTLWIGYDLSQDSHGRIDNCYWRQYLASLIFASLDVKGLFCTGIICLPEVICVSEKSSKWGLRHQERADRLWIFAAQFLVHLSYTILKTGLLVH